MVYINSNCGTFIANGVLVGHRTCFCMTLSLEWSLYTCMYASHLYAEGTLLRILPVYLTLSFTLSCQPNWSGSYMSICIGISLHRQTRIEHTGTNIIKHKLTNRNLSCNVIYCMTLFVWCSRYRHTHTHTYTHTHTHTHTHILLCLTLYHCISNILLLIYFISGPFSFDIDL